MYLVYFIISTKLEILGVGGKLLVWIREFLLKCTMIVKVTRNMSSLREVTSGVPQESMLGPV